MKNLIAIAVFMLVSIVSNAQFASRCSVITTMKEKYLPAGVELDTPQALTHNWAKINILRTYDATAYDGSPANEAFELLAGALKTTMVGVAYSAFGIDTSAAANVHANIVITDVWRGWPCVTPGDKKDIYDACEDVYYVAGYIQWDRE